MKKRLLILLILLSGVSNLYAQLNKSYFYYRGRNYIVQEQYREAIESLNVLLRVEPKEFEGYFLRGVAKYNLDDLTGALTDFSKAIDENPAYTQAFQYRAITHSRMGMYNEALEDFHKAITFRPNEAGSYYSRGVTFFLNRQFEKSVEDFSSFLRIEPLQPEGYVSRGTSYLYMKDTVQAMNDYNRAVKVNPYWSDAFLRRGLLLLIQKDFEKSVSDFSQAVKIDTTLALGYFYRGVAKNNLNDIYGALFDFDKSIQNDSTSAIAYYNRAILRSSIGDYNNAIDDYTKIAESNSQNVLVYYNRAAVYAQIGEYQKAIEDYSRAIEIYPDFANAYRYRSQLKGISGDITGAKADQKIAENKIQEYRTKMNDSTFSVYADTSKQFNKILSFDANDLNKNKTFSDIRSRQGEIAILPMYRFTIAVPDTAFQAKRREKYQNRKLTEFIDKSYITGLQLRNTPTDLSYEYVEYVDNRNDNPTSWNNLFSKGITQTLLSQYNNAMEYWNKAIEQKPEEAASFINRAVTQAEMIEFIASLEGSYQAVNIANDPTTRLRQKERSERFDYSQAIADLNQAAELMPELPHIYFNLANLLYLSDDIPQAIEMYNKAIELYPLFGEAYYNRAMMQLSLGENTKACLDLSLAGEMGVDRAYQVIRATCTSK
ncbi:MAG: tetratricopeptide repeat protein [Rikenellaceae bacterium]